MSYRKVKFMLLHPVQYLLLSVQVKVVANEQVLAYNDWAVAESVYQDAMDRYIYMVKGLPADQMNQYQDPDLGYAGKHRAAAMEKWHVVNNRAEAISAVLNQREIGRFSDPFDKKS